MTQPLVLLGVLLALLAGLAAGKAWERYKLVEGRWIESTDNAYVGDTVHFNSGALLGKEAIVTGYIVKATTIPSEVVKQVLDIYNKKINSLANIY